jgi:hypothetical protein
MDAALQEYVRFCDAAIAAASNIVNRLQTHDPDHLRDMAEQTLQELREIKDSALDGTLPRPSRGAGFGLSRAVGEWAYDTELMKASLGLERFYQTSM